MSLAVLSVSPRTTYIHRHPEVSLEVVEVETLLILQENPFDFVLELADPVSRWMFLISSSKFYSSICDWKNELSIYLEKYYFLCFESFLSRFPMRPIASNSSMSATIMSPFQNPCVQSVNNPSKTFFPN